VAESLERQEVLILDCQTTGANPQQGHLLEIAWCRTAANRSRCGRIHSHLLKLPPGAQIPRRVTALTGIRKSHLRSAHEPRQVWSRLIGDFGSGDLPTVIHFARFELPFLRSLHWQCGKRTRFPFEPICTHEIARRMFPGLPRRTLRALAGYFGHNAPQLKRARDHVRATAVIWRELVGLLDRECQVSSLEELEAWLAEPPPSRSKKRSYPMARDRRLSLPDRPGIYRLLDSRGQVLYVGKASSLKHRVNSYFQKQKGYSEKNLEMLTRVREVDVQECGSALEAALLETDEIKKHKPIYNQALQELDPRVWFTSRTFKSVSFRPGKRHPVGPLPYGQALSGVGLLYDLVRRDKPASDLQSTCAAILDMPRVFCPPDSCFRAGLELFGFRQVSSPQELLGLGHRLWSEMQESEPEEKEAENSRTWTVDGVVRALQGTLIRAAHLVRRGRWLCWLCEAELVWESKEGRERKLYLGSGKLVPESRGINKRSLRQRQADFDLATYDRLRVLTTELRRLTADERRLQLRLGPRMVLDREALVKVLRWV
jgi:DNA polymerase-3 subunit epsilon